MTKAELVKRITVAADGALTREETARFIDAVFDHISAAVVAEGRFAYPDFGSWIAGTRKERRAHNPRTRTEMRVPATRSVRFQPAEPLLTAVRDRPTDGTD